MSQSLADLIDPAAKARLQALAGVTVTASAPPAETDAATGELEVKADTPDVLEHKGDAMGGAQVLSADPETGLVTALVSVTGVEDRVKDVIEPGAYTKTMATRDPIGVWSHDDKTWVARTESATELMPGDPFFRDLKTMDGQPWPAAAGAVKVEARFNLDTPHGAAAFSDVKFFEGKTGWSIGYRATRATRNPRTGVRSIKELEWFEYSPVMVGAASQPMTLSVKSFGATVDPDDDTGLVDDAVLSTLGEDEIKRYDALRSSLGLETKARVQSAEGARKYGQPIGSVIVPDSAESGHGGGRGDNGHGIVTDADLAAMVRDAAARGDQRELSMLREAAKLDPKKRRHALTHAEDGVLAKPGDDGKPGPGKAPAPKSAPKPKADADAAPIASSVLDSAAARRELVGRQVVLPDGGTGRITSVDSFPNTGMMQVRRDGSDDAGSLRNWKVGELRLKPAPKGSTAARSESKAIPSWMGDKAKLAALNKRRRARGLKPLDALPDDTKALDLDLIEVLLDDDAEVKGSSASLDRSPRSNWVEKAGELPPYVREVARSIEKSGHTLSQAIQIAIGRIKTWARGGGGVTAETQAKAKKAAAEWELLKAKSHTKFDSELLEHLEWKASAEIDAAEDAWAALYDLGELDAKADAVDEADPEPEPEPEPEAKALPDAGADAGDDLADAVARAAALRAETKALLA